MYIYVSSYYSYIYSTVTIHSSMHSYLANYIYVQKQKLSIHLFQKLFIQYSQVLVLSIQTASESLKCKLCVELILCS